MNTFERDKKYIAGTYGRFPLEIVSGKGSLVYDEKIPCTRTDIIETELLNTLNGVDLFGTGRFQFNRDLSTTDKQLLTLSNSKQFFGSYLTMSVRWVDTSGEVCG